MNKTASGRKEERESEKKIEMNRYIYSNRVRKTMVCWVHFCENKILIGMAAVAIPKMPENCRVH